MRQEASLSKVLWCVRNYDQTLRIAQRFYQFCRSALSTFLVGILTMQPQLHNKNLSRACKILTSTWNPKSDVSRLTRYEQELGM